METGLATSEAKQHNDSLSALFAGAVSFFLGVIVVFVALALIVDEPVDVGADGSAAEPAIELSRAVGEPLLETQVAGIQCDRETATITSLTNPDDMAALWNDRVTYSGNECTPDFASVLGPDWMISDPYLSVFNDSGSLYEIDATNGAVGRVSIYLVTGDAPYHEDLVSLVESLVGATNVEWGGSCADSERGWVGYYSSDALYLEVTSCEI